MAEDECVQQYICNFGTIVDKLAETGVTLQEELYVIMLLASLPKSYENLVVALEARDDLPKLSTLKVKLIEEGERRKVNNSGTTSTDSSVQVFMAKEKKSNQRNSYRKNNNNTNENNGSRRKSNFKCFSCGRIGHYAAQCKEKGAKAEQKDDRTHRAFSISNDCELRKNIWCVDSGASTHLCCDRNMFDQFEEHEEEIVIAGSNRIQTEGKGQVYIKEFDLTLKEVLYVSCLQCYFISVAKAVSNGCTVTFDDTKALIKKGGKVWLTAKRVGGLFLCGVNDNECLFSCETTEEAMKWHRRFGHMNFASLRQLINKEMVFGVKLTIPDNMSCNVCLQCKCSVRPFKHSENRANDLLEIIHSDVCGPMNTTSSGGAKYMLTFIDDKSRYVFVYFLKNKSEVFGKFKEFKSMVERQTDRKIKILRSDNGTEFVNGAFDEYLREHGIVRQLTVPYTPQQNGVAERFNRTLVEMARCMLVDGGVAENLWAEAINTAAYLRNRCPTKALCDVTPHEVWFGRKPVVKHLRAFGSTVIVLDKKKHDKFKSKGKEYIRSGIPTRPRLTDYMKGNSEQRRLLL